jgi:glycosyltransferase involved in cell wall biosynthesis
MTRGELKWGAFHACEAFVLPSHQENFGIAVAEALACGKPVLMSNRVNIWREVEQDGAGFVANDTYEGTRELIARWLTLTPDARSAMGSAASESFRRRFTVDAMAQSLLSVLGAPARVSS